MKKNNQASELEQVVFKIIAFLKDKSKILLTTHDQADIDALASLVVFKHVLTLAFQDKKKKFILHARLSKSSQTYLHKFKQKFPEISIELESNPPSFLGDVIIILDTNNPNQITFMRELNFTLKNYPYFFIDHHVPTIMKQNSNLTEFNLILPQFSSTSEIIWEIGKILDIKLPTSLKFLLLAGLLIDSGFFMHGNNDTIKRAALLLNEKDILIKDVMEMLEEEPSLSEKIAMIKGLQRLKLMKKKGWLIGISHVGSHEADLASLLVKIGCDVSLVYSKKRREHFRISMRAKMKLCDQYGLNLSEILQSVSDISDGNGGGHPCAASLNGQKSLERTVEEILKKILKILNE
ncbi:MAG: DHH family phosphoesterase [Promethearchaeota archaeon]